MNTKLIAVLVAVIVFGCVVVAGCVSSTTQHTGSDNQIAGTWINNDGTAKFIITENCTGTYYQQDNGTWKEIVPVLWSRNTDGTYSLINGEAKATVTVNTIKGQFTTDSGSIYTKQTSDTSGFILSGSIGKPWSNLHSNGSSKILVRCDDDDRKIWMITNENNATISLYVWESTDYKNIENFKDKSKLIAGIAFSERELHEEDAKNMWFGGKNLKDECEDDTDIQFYDYEVTEATYTAFVKGAEKSITYTEDPYSGKFSIDILPEDMLPENIDNS